MKHRLDKLCFLPPPASTPWSGSPTESTRYEVQCAGGKVVVLDLPLFWFNPRWHELSTDMADLVAVTVARLGVLVAAMRSDLAGPESESSFHGVAVNEQQAVRQDGKEVNEESDRRENENGEPCARIVPYRPERYGLGVGDFDHASVIDVRLSMNRDESGRFAFSPEQIQRWEATPSSHPLAGGSWVPSASFPPDVPSMKHLASKLSQLRSLSPGAAVFVSLGCYRLPEELPPVIAARPDGLILRLDDVELDGFQLASITRHVRQLMDDQEATELPLWIVPGRITADDAVKLVALGASAVAVDDWCSEIIEEATTRLQESSRYASRASHEEFLFQLVGDVLAARIERFSGLYNSIDSLPPSERLGCLSETWANALVLRSVPM